MYTLNCQAGMTFHWLAGHFVFFINFDRKYVFIIRQISKITMEDHYDSECLRNFSIVRQKLMNCLRYVQQHADDYTNSWEMLLSLEEDFRTLRLPHFESEFLYSGMQNLVGIVKKRRDHAPELMSGATKKIYKGFEKEVKHFSVIAETADIQETWDRLTDLSDRIRCSPLVFMHRIRLLDSMHDIFITLRKRRNEHDHIQCREAGLNAIAISQRLEYAAREIDTVPVFRKNWDLLIDIQREFQGKRLNKEDRERLHDKIQNLFETLKTKHEVELADFDKVADASYRYLQPKVIKAVMDSRRSPDLEETRQYIAAVKYDLKEFCLHSADRDQLTHLVNAAYQNIRIRMKEDFAKRKEMKELSIRKKIADLRKRIEDLEEEIRQQEEKLKPLEKELKPFRILLFPHERNEPLARKIAIIRHSINIKTLQIAEDKEEIKKIREKESWLENN